MEDKIREGTDTAGVVARRVTAEVREAREKVSSLRERYANSKQNYSDKKEELLQSKERYRECLSSDTENCKLKIKDKKKCKGAFD